MRGPFRANAVRLRRKGVIRAVFHRATKWLTVFIFRPLTGKSKKILFDLSGPTSAALWALVNGVNGREIKFLSEEFAYGLYDVFLLLFLQFRKDGQGEARERRLFSDREVAFLVPEIREAGLQMEGYRIVNTCGDALLL